MNNSKEAFKSINSIDSCRFVFEMTNKLVVKGPLRRTQWISSMSPTIKNIEITSK